MMGLLASLAASGLLVATLTGAGSVRVPGPDVRIGDVAALSGPGSAAAASLTIARLPAGNTRSLTRRQIADLVRRALPLAIVEGQAGADIRLWSPAPSAAALPACFEALAAIAPGNPVERADVRAVGCDSKRPLVPVVFDRDRLAAIAKAAVRPGDYLGRLDLGSDRRVDRGAKLTLVAASGPVTVARRVTALQPVRQGQRRLFVRTDDGSVFSAPVSADLRK